jgi:hypothetical protein
MPRGEAHVIVALPRGQYRLEVISSSAAWRNEVRVWDLRTSNNLAVVGNQGAPQQVAFVADADIEVRVSHFYANDRQGSIERVVGQSDRHELTFYCEDYRDADYNDLQACIRRYADGDFVNQIPVYPAGSSETGVVRDLTLVDGAGGYEIPGDYQMAGEGTLKIEHLPNLVAAIGGTTQALVEAKVQRLVIEAEAYNSNAMDMLAGHCWAAPGALSEDTGKARWDLEFKTADGSGYPTTDWKLIKVTAFLR